MLNASNKNFGYQMHRGQIFTTVELIDSTCETVGKPPICNDENVLIIRLFITFSISLIVKNKGYYWATDTSLFAKIIIVKSFGHYMAHNMAPIRIYFMTDGFKIRKGRETKQTILNQINGITH